MRSSRRKIVGTLSVVVLTCVLALAGAPAYAEPVFGGQLWGLGPLQNVQVEVVQGGYADFTSECYLYAYTGGAPTYIGTNRDVGRTVSLGTFDAGRELVFGIYVPDTGFTYYMGPGERNPDGVIHATVDVTGTNQSVVGFEDMYWGGDRDYDDCMLKISGVTNVSPVPEPSTIALLCCGGAGLLPLWRRRRAR